MATSKWKLEGRIAVVTGATRGIGAAIVEEFLSLGARVLFAARGRDELEARETEWRNRGLDARGIAADLASTEGRAEFIECGFGHLGKRGR